MTTIWWFYNISIKSINNNPLWSCWYCWCWFLLVFVDVVGIIGICWCCWYHWCWLVSLVLLVLIPIIKFLLFLLYNNHQILTIITKILHTLSYNHHNHHIHPYHLFPSFSHQYTIIYHHNKTYIIICRGVHRCSDEPLFLSLTVETKLFFESVSESIVTPVTLHKCYRLLLFNRHMVTQVRCATLTKTVFLPLLFQSWKLWVNWEWVILGYLNGNDDTDYDEWWW